MKVYRIQTLSGSIHYAVREEDQFLRCSGNLSGGFQITDEILEANRILAPVQPTTLFAIGLNYREHAKEMEKEIPAHPVVTMKNIASVIANEDPIELPRYLASDSVDFEGELAIVIGRPCKNATPANALQSVAGYCVANDVSARDWQKIYSGGQWCKGKGFDTFCPLGPALVTPEEISNPNDLRIRSFLNEECFQDSSTSDLIFSVEDLISFLSGSTTLLPGTVILSGTPSGVGSARKPPRFLQPNDRVDIQIESLGTLTNCVKEELVQTV